jgi:hypothetical protein
MDKNIDSQNKHILEWMQKGKKVSCLMAWTKFGCGALHSRMSDLRKQYEIKDKWVTVNTSFGVKRVKEYWL